MAVEFAPAARAEFEKILARYPVKRAALVPALWLAQREYGWLSLEVLAYVAKLLDLTPAYVGSVASFYTLFNKQPVGKYHVQVCRNVSCSLVGSEDIVGTIRRRLGIDVGQTTPDGKFTLTLVECLGSCGTAPMMQINDDYWEKLTAERTVEILDQLDKA